MSTSNNLSNLLRNSRIAHVPKNKKPLTSSSNSIFYPTHQIISTKPALLHRQEWGLKASIPTKNKSQYLVFNDLDTLERVTTFEKNGGKQWNRLRFKELNVSPSYNPGVANPLFESRSSTTDPSAPLSSILNVKLNDEKKTNKKIQNIQPKRLYFKHWLLDNDPESLKNKRFNMKDMSENAIRFLKSNTVARKKSFLDKNSMKNVIGTGGLTYNLRGKLRNSPNGIVQKNIVPGRFLNVETNNRLAAIGGFVSNASSSSPINSQANYAMGDFIREVTFPFDVQHASVHDNGKILIRAKVVYEINEKTKAQMSGINYRQRPATTRLAIKQEDSVKHAEELLDLLTKFGN